MVTHPYRLRSLVILWALFSILLGCQQNDHSPNTDEAAKRALARGISISEAADEYTYGEVVPDFFQGMDIVSERPMNLGPDQLLDLRSNADKKEDATHVSDPNLSSKDIIGRNTWMIWCGGNEGFWDWLANENFGFIDLLKLVDSRKRDDRFRDTGMINEPGMARGTATDQFGLWLDIPTDPAVRKWRGDYTTDTFEQIKHRKHPSQVGILNVDRLDNDNSGVAGSSYNQPYNRRLQADMPEHAEYSGGQVAKDLISKVPPPDWYGLSSGVIGLRLFPNPYFDEQAQAKWNPKRYYDDPTYYNDPKLVRPFRVGMSCAFCHASFHPLNPPLDVSQPQWANLSGNIGAQYLSMRATVGSQLTPDQFAYHLLDSQPRGTIDTSLIASDNINNPNTMNAVFGLKQRILLSFFNPEEKLSPASATLPTVWGNPASIDENNDDTFSEELRAEIEMAGLLSKVEASNSNPRHVPRVLLDGSDSIGAVGALARVYLNIGMYWEQWNALHQPVLGLTKQSPFRLKDCETNSVYWNATTKRVPGLRDYFLKVSSAMPLLSTPDSARRLESFSVERIETEAKKMHVDAKPLLEKEYAKRINVRQLAHGRQVFAQNCIVCHSSIQPESTLALAKLSPKDLELEEADFSSLIERRNQIRFEAAKTGEFWEHDPAQWLQDAAYKKWAASVVNKPTFWTENYLSIDYRIPVSYVGTNSSRAMGTNALTGHVWQDFASESYRELPAPGALSYFNPYAGEHGEIQQYKPRHRSPSESLSSGEANRQDEVMAGGGPGFYRVPTLISIWATAPFLHNNSLGLYNNDPSVDGRLLAFDDAIRKMLWPERRLQSSSYNNATAERLQKDHGLIWRTPEESYLVINGPRVPFFARRLPFVQSLSDYRGLRWIGDVKPLWLPSAVLFVASLVILLVSSSERRRSIGNVAIVVAAIGSLIYLLAELYPKYALSQWVLIHQPWWIVPLLLIVTAIILRLPLSKKGSRFTGYAYVILSLLLGAAIYFNSGKLGDIKIGPIPAGTPVNLLANVNPEADYGLLKANIQKASDGLAEIGSRHLEQADAEMLLKKKIAPALMEINKCPDFVMDKGHYFPWFANMTDDDKNVLIELLKTF